MRKTVSILLIVIALLLVACRGGEETPTAVPTVEIPTLAPISTSTPIPEAATVLQSTPWQWVSYLDQAVGVTTIPDPQNYTVSFLADGSVQVKADCNNAFGTYTTSGDSLTIALGPMTLAACPDGSRSDQFVALLGSAAKYAIIDNQLRIDLMADAGNLTFIPQWANPPSSPTPEQSQATAVPPTPIPSQPTPVPPSGSGVDSGPRQYAMGTYAAPYYTVAAGDTLYSIGLRFWPVNGSTHRGESVCRQWHYHRPNPGYSQWGCASVARFGKSRYDTSNILKYSSSNYGKGGTARSGIGYGRMVFSPRRLAPFCFLWFIQISTL